MKTILTITMFAFFAIASISAETKQECTKKAMDVNKEERKACDSKTGDENKACKKESTDKLTAAKHACNEAGKK